MSTRNSNARLQDILHHIKKLDEFFHDISFEMFIESEKDIFAIAMCFTIIGEASSHIPASFQKQYAHIPWKEMKDMRNFAVHQYWEINSKILWDTYYDEIQALKIQIQAIINDSSAS